MSGVMRSSLSAVARAPKSAPFAIVATEFAGRPVKIYAMVFFFEAHALLRAVKNENASFVSLFVFRLQRVAVGRADSIIDEARAALGPDDGRDVETAVRALHDRELLSIGFVARDIAPFEGKRAVGSDKRHAEYQRGYRRPRRKELPGHDVLTFSDGSGGGTPFSLAAAFCAAFARLNAGRSRRRP